MVGFKTRTLLILFCSLVFLLIGCSDERLQSPKAEQGILDLREWSFSEQGQVELNGEWAFYWEELLEPVDFHEDTYVVDVKLKEMPNTWDGHEINGSTLTKYGYATYRLEIWLDESEVGELKALRMPEVFSSYHL